MFDENVGQRIKRVRKARGLSQAQFAEALGVFKGHISKIESGAANPSEQLLKGISREFKVREEWLRSGVARAIAKDEKFLAHDLCEEFELSYGSNDDFGLLNTLMSFENDVEEMIKTINNFTDLDKIISSYKILLWQKEEILTDLSKLGESIKSLFSRLESKIAEKERMMEAFQTSRKS